MRKKVLSGIVMSIVSISTFAGGLLTNTNQNAAFLRNPARDAVIAIDGVYSNPAGIAFLPQGFHLSLSWQAAFQKRQITSTFPYYAYGEGNNNATTKYFEGKATAPVIPSFQAAYVINDKWSVSAQFAVGGGGGECEFENGLATFEKLVGKQLIGANAASYAMEQQLTGKQYFYGIQLGATYKIGDKVSVFGGARAVLASCGYEASIKNIKAAGALTQNQMVGAGDYLNTLAAYLQATGGSADNIAAAQTGAALLGEDLILDCSQSGFGITPIIGVDVNLGKLNLAAKYEFRTKINLENDSKNSSSVDVLYSAYANGQKVRSDIPALLTVGAQYAVLPTWRVGAGYHLYFDTDAKGGATEVADNTWEFTFGTEWDATKRLTLSAGVQRTKYGFADEQMSDMNFNISSVALCVGGAYKFSDKVKMNVGYMHSFYEDHNVVSAENISDLYTRKNDVVGVSLELKF